MTSPSAGTKARWIFKNKTTGQIGHVTFDPSGPNVNVPEKRIEYLHETLTVGCSQTVEVSLMNLDESNRHGWSIHTIADESYSGVWHSEIEANATDIPFIRLGGQIVSEEGYFYQYEKINSPGEYVHLDENRIEKKIDLSWVNKASFDDDAEEKISTIAKTAITESKSINQFVGVEMQGDVVHFTKRDISVGIAVSIEDGVFTGLNIGQVYRITIQLKNDGDAGYLYMTTGGAQSPIVAEYEANSILSTSMLMQSVDNKCQMKVSNNGTNFTTGYIIIEGL